MSGRTARHPLALPPPIRLPFLGAALRDAWFKLLLAVLLAAIWGLLLASLKDDRRQIERDALRHAADLAALAEQGIARTIEAIDQRLLFARDAYRRDPARFSLSFIGAGSGYDDGMMMQLALIGRDGILADSNIGPSNHADLSDRPHYRVHLARPEDFLYVSQPVLGRVSHRWSVQFTRKVIGPDGAFAGVMVGSLDPVWMTSLFHALGVSGGLALVGDDGVVRAAAPDLSRIGQDLSGSRLWEAARASPDGTLLLRERAAPLAVGIRHLAHYPLSVMVSLDMARAMALHRAHLHARVLLGLGLSLLVLVAGLRLLHGRRSLLASQRELRHAVESIDQGLVMLDPQGRIRVSNRRFGALMRLPAALSGSGVAYAALAAHQAARGITDAAGLPAATLPRGLPEDAPSPAASPRPAPARVEERCLDDGTVIEVRARTLEDGAAVCTFADITARRRAQERIHHLAHHDVLTGLANRALLHESLHKALERARRGRGRLALLCLDLDRFKPVNDGLGHAAGDALLCEVAERIARIADEGGGLAARFGGDEFVVLLPDAGPPAEVAALAERLGEAVARPFRHRAHEVSVQASIGIALHPGDGDAPDVLLHNADVALYRAKESGRGQARFFEARMEERLRLRAGIECDLRGALAGNQLALHFQPLQDCASGRARAFEALLRWQHPQRGLVPPSEFIPVAEECGLILPISRWVLEEACRVAATWPGGQSVAVNLSPMQFRHHDLVSLVKDTLRDTGLEPHRLELEVTEGILVEDAAGALGTMEALKALGVRFALDDFGTGYSSLSYLQRFPFDKIKIDKAFVQALETQQSACVIIDAILAIGRSLDLRITAEGVETERQLRFLRQRACDQVQGFLLGRPMPAHALAPFLWEGVDETLLC